MDTKRGSISSCSGEGSFDHGLKLALSFPEQHFVSQIFLSLLQSWSAGSPNAPEVSRMKGR